MTRRQAWISGAALALLSAISIFTLDGVLARSMQPFANRNREMLAPFMDAIEWLFAFNVSKFATGAAIIVVALLLFAFRNARPTAWRLLFVGGTHLVARLIAGVLKNVFLRTRPYEMPDRFFAEGGSSFPSGHAAHFWALFFALAIAFPRLRIPALILALAVSLARIIVNDHYLGDVLASAAICALVAAAFAGARVRTAIAPAATDA